MNLDADIPYWLPAYEKDHMSIPQNYANDMKLLKTLFS